MKLVLTKKSYLILLLFIISILQLHVQLHAQMIGSATFIPSRSQEIIRTGSSYSDYIYWGDPINFISWSRNGVTDIKIGVMRFEFDHPNFPNSRLLNVILNLTYHKDVSSIFSNAPGVANIVMPDIACNNFYNNWNLSTPAMDHFPNSFSENGYVLGCIMQGNSVFTEAFGTPNDGNLFEQNTSYTIHNPDVGIDNLKYFDATSTKFTLGFIPVQNAIAIQSISVTLFYSIDPIGNNTICCNQSFIGSGNPVMLTGSVPSGGNNSTYTYQWQSSFDNALWTNISGATGASYDPPIINQITYYRRMINSAPASPSPSNSVIIDVNLSNNTIGSNQTFTGSGDPSLLIGSTPSGGGGSASYTYQWESSTDNLNWINISGATSINYDPPAINQITYFRRKVFSGSVQITSAPVIMTVNLSNNTIASNQTFTGAGDPVLLVGSIPIGGGGSASYSYQWESSTDNINWTSISGATLINYDPLVINQITYFHRKVFSGSLQITSSPVTMTVNLSNNTIGSNQTFTGSEILTMLTGSTPTGGRGSASYTYQWETSIDNTNWTTIPNTNTLNYDPGFVYQTTYYHRIVNSAGVPLSTSNFVVISVTLFNLSNNSIGDNQTFNGSGFNQIIGSVPTGGSGVAHYTYQWQSSTDNVNWSTVSTNDIAYLAPPIAQTTYYRRIVNSIGVSFSTSNVIMITANISNNLIAGNQSFTGNGDPTLLLGSIPTGGNGSGSYTYQWQSSDDNANWTNIVDINTIDYDPPSIYGTTYYRRIVNSVGVSPSTSNTVKIYINITNNSIVSDQIFTGPGDPVIFNGSYATGGVVSYEWQSSVDGVTWASIANTNLRNYNPTVLYQTTYFKRIAYDLYNHNNRNVSNIITITIIPANLSNNSIALDQYFGDLGYPVLLTGSVPTGGDLQFYIYQWQSSNDNTNWTNIANETHPTYGTPFIYQVTYYRRIVNCAGFNSSISNVIKLKVNISNNTIIGNQAFTGTGDPVLLTGTIPSGGYGNSSYLYRWQSCYDNINWATDPSGDNTKDFVTHPQIWTTYYRRIVESMPISDPGDPIPIPYSISNVVIIPINISNNSISGNQTYARSGNPILLKGSIPTGGAGTAVGGSYVFQWQSSANNVIWTPIVNTNTKDYDPPVLYQTTYYRRIVNSDPASPSTSNVVKISINAYKTEEITSTIFNSQNDPFDKSISVYPNPFKSEIHISFNDNVGEKYLIQMYNVSGKLVFSEIVNTNINGINIGSELASGFYMITIRRPDEATNTYKVVKIEN